MQANVSEIHRYPLRPEGFEEPLFPTRESKIKVLDHLLRAPWLARARRLSISILIFQFSGTTIVSSERLAMILYTILP